jgi:uncharacterized protein involved in propanediol utilization
MNRKTETLPSKTTQVIQPLINIPAEEIIKAITEISSAMKVLSTTRLTRKAVVSLIHDQSKLPKKTIDIVLNNLQDLERDWLKSAQQGK